MNTGILIIYHHYLCLYPLSIQCLFAKNVVVLFFYHMQTIKPKLHLSKQQHKKLKEHQKSRKGTKNLGKASMTNQPIHLSI